MTWNLLWGKNSGFALPTILIASVVMIIVMLAGVQAVTSIRVSLDNNYYNKMAEETAQAGITKAVECVKAFSSSEWGNGGSSGPLTPNSKCDGTGGGGYLINNSKVRSTYSVDKPVISGSGVVVSVNSTVERLRTSDSQPWRTFTSAQNAKLAFASFDITAGNYTTCSTVNGVLWCWGANGDGQIGDGTRTDRPSPTKVIDGDLAGKYVYDSTTGLHHGCAIAGTGSTPTFGDTKVYCWGDNSMAQLGLGTTTNTASQLKPKASLGLLNLLVPNLKYTDISAGNRTCVIGEAKTGSSRVWCWSDNFRGTAADDDAKLYSKPYAVQNHIFTSSVETSFGALRYATNNANPKPNSNTLLDAKQLSLINTSFGCEVSSSNRAYCWGGNGNGGLGVGSTTLASVSQTGFARMVGSTPSNPTYTQSYFKKIFVNWGRACAVGAPGGNATTDGKIYCWGHNGVGEEGSGTNDYRISVDVPTIENGSPIDMIPSGSLASARFSDIAAADWATCVLGANGSYAGKVYCWGYDDLGQLGDGGGFGNTHPIAGQNTPYSNRPRSPRNMVAVGGALAGKTVVKLAAGNANICAMTINGASYCWGGNKYGQVGDGTTIDRAAPVRTKVPTSVTLF